MEGLEMSAIDEIMDGNLGGCIFETKIQYIYMYIYMHMCVCMCPRVCIS